MAHRKRHILKGIAAGILLLAGAMALRTVRLPSGPSRPPGPPLPALSVSEEAAHRLGAAIRFRTVSGTSKAEFQAFHEHLKSAFPRAARSLSWEAVGEGSLLLTWSGRDPGLPPVALLGHLDTVPAEEAGWAQPPYSGVHTEGFIWGRGSLDDKGSVLAQLEAVEALLTQGWTPARTILLAYGHDEETSGSGARALAAFLRARGIRLSSVLDEGSVLAVDLVPGIRGPVALVGTQEKGYLTLKLTARGDGGHAAIPIHPSAPERLAGALNRLRCHPIPARLHGPAQAMFEALAPDFPMPTRMVLANLWLTRPLLLPRLEGTPATAALVRTTAVVTRLSAGTTDNVVPGQAEATVNLRLAPGDTLDSVLAHVKRAVADPAVEITRVPGAAWNPSPASPTDGVAYRHLADSIREVFPEARVAPALVLAATDARHYADLTQSVYRFLPVPFTGADLDRLHGRNERIAVADHLRAAQFYGVYFRRCAGAL